MKRIKLMGLNINQIIALKNKFKEMNYPKSFYIAMKERLKGKTKEEIKSYGCFLINDLHYHWKEFSQYQ